MGAGVGMVTRASQLHGMYPSHSVASIAYMYLARIHLTAPPPPPTSLALQVTVVACESGRPLSEQYASLCTALAVGEAHRDAGGDALVVLDDARCVVELWESMVR